MVATMSGAFDLLIRGARLVPVGGPAPAEAVDVRIQAGVITEVAPCLRPRRGEDVLAAEGRWAIPGLWDKHVHPVFAGLAARRIDLAGSTGPADVCRRVAAHLTAHPGADLVSGYGYRSGAWKTRPTVAELDAVTGDRPVVLEAGDGHNGWLNSAAFRLVGLEPQKGALAEEAWFAAYKRLEGFAAQGEDREGALDGLLARAAARGVVGIVDFEFNSAFRHWPQRLERGLPPVRVRAATYADALDEVAAQGLRTGDPLGCDLVTMGPLKVISDGSLNTLTAWCHEPYAHGTAQPCGAANLDQAELVRIMLRAKEIGVSAAIHAIGDAALCGALDAFAETGQGGSVEHVQLARWDDLGRMARLGLTASVQPAHLLDDRDVTELHWPDRAGRVYAFRALQRAGIPLALGSDAPVSPLDPWLAMAAAVHRSADDRPPWHPEQALTAAEALAASTDGWGTIAPGHPGDIVLLEADPLAGDPADTAATAARLRGMDVAATIVAGRISQRT